MFQWYKSSSEHHPKVTPVNTQNPKTSFSTKSVAISIPNLKERIRSTLCFRVTGLCTTHTGRLNVVYMRHCWENQRVVFSPTK